MVDPGQVITDGEALVSTGGIFELGFFGPGSDTSSRYLGIWYKSVTPRVIVWVANREAPLRDTSGALNLTIQGVLVLVNSTNIAQWSSNTSRTVQDPVVQLLDTGNLVVREKDNEDQENYLWQSFDYPGDTLLPGLKIGKDLRTGFETYLSAWKSTDDPSLGLFSIHMDARGYPQLVVKKGNATQYRAGSWNGLTWTGTPFLVSSPSYMLKFEFNEKEVYYKFDVQDSSNLIWSTLTSTGVLQRYSWSNQSRTSQVVSSSRTDSCENYALCGSYSSCTYPGSPLCSCLDGFVAKSPSEWNSGNWSSGCVRRTPLGCDAGDWFLKCSKIRLPDTSSSTWSNSSRSLDECERLCLNNCNCSGYTYLDVRGTGCLFWHDELVDIRTLDEGGQDLFVRLAASEHDELGKQRPFDKQKKAAIIAGSAVFVVAIAVLMICLRFRRRKSIRKAALVSIVGEIKEEADAPIFDLNTITNATNNFSNYNKLGQGGFGPVYKGTLANGQDIAVKTLSKNSSQGLTEFKTEVKLIAKLQHRNLVRLLGFCIHEDEKMLVYEYMTNKSLDFYIFDKARSKMLDWAKRVSIIGGIARGLLYLHQDSRLKIVHRDLKASNILLDSNMNAKISDFGLARTFGADQSEANTNKIVGTYGYMAPEYVMDGLFSTNSDVFSFGVLVLEIISGKKNRGFYHREHDLNLLGHAWMLWTKEKPLDLMDECLATSCEPVEVTRCIHLALLCVQQRPENRPTMAAVVMMLSTENLLPEPNQPGYFMERNPPPPPSHTSRTCSANDATITVLEAR